MTKQILINAAPWETRVAVLEDTTLVELHVERGRDKGLAGNVYKGRVVRVLPGMQAAFVDIGLEKAAFLHVSDLVGPDLVRGVVEESIDTDDVEVESAPRRRVQYAPIEERLTKNQELLVQVSKEPMGTKGARVTAQISLPGRHLVHMPGTDHVGISRRIEDPEERERLRDAVESERSGPGGFIVRTACAGATKREIRDDVRFLTRLWSHLQHVAEGATAPALVHRDLDLVLRVLRDLFTPEVDRVVVDDVAEHARVIEFVEALVPRLASHVHLYQGTTPLFEQHGVETKIARALDRRVWLKSGGYLVFDQTESLTTVDVNTGRYVGKKDQEETVLRTNLEAAKQVVQQLRLRNIGGIIVIDFIDMEKPANRKKVFDALQEAASTDKARSNVLQISEMGLVQMTRKRTRESLGQQLLEPCPHCDGLGRLRATETIAYEALRRVQRAAAEHEGGRPLTLTVHSAVAEFLRSDAAGHVEQLRARLGRPINVDSSSDFARDAIDVAVG
ncbi:MAG TPA: Rne/Rng family ribonuclease [Candidatus Eisenbacteria bacterium]|nr:Rne/Rng family ribonuclease [Candidatus Eisenbacteria bacterium]